MKVEYNPYSWNQFLIISLKNQGPQNLDQLLEVHRKRNSWLFMISRCLLNMCISIQRFVLASPLIRGISLGNRLWKIQRLITYANLREYEHSSRDRTTIFTFHTHPEAQDTSQKREEKECMSQTMGRKAVI